MTQRRRWFVDPFDPDDEAVRRGREALNLQPVEPPRPSEPKAEQVGEVSPTSNDPAPALDKRRRVADLVRRLRNGDLSARQALEELLR